MSGKCPKREKPVATAKLEPMNISDGRLVVRAFGASCPYCGSTAN